METIVAHPENKEQVEVIKAFFKALKIKFETNVKAQIEEEVLQVNETEVLYSEDVEILTEGQLMRLEQSRASIKAGNFKSNDQIKK